MKDKVYRVAVHYGLHVFVVSNRMIAAPESPLLERVVVDSEPDVADDWSAEHTSGRNIVITADIPLAARCVQQGSYVLEPKERPPSGP